jgi:TrmH family RNA methyltransferase
MCGLYNQGQRARPEFVRENQKHVGHIANQRDGLLDGIHQDGKSFGFRPAFGLEHGFDGREIKWIGAKAVESVRRNANYFAAIDESGGVVHHAFLGGFGGYFKNFDRQLFARGVLRQDSLGNYHSRTRAGKALAVMTRNGTSPAARSRISATAERLQRASSAWVYARSGVCYACCMAQQFPAEKRAPTESENVRVRPREKDPLTEAALNPGNNISSRDNKWLKKFRYALRGTGPLQGEPIATEGPKLVEEGIRSGLEAEALLVSDSGERHLERILQAASASESGIPRSRIFRTTDKLFESVAGTESPQGVAAFFRQREWNFDDVMRGRASEGGAYRSEAPLLVVMAAVQDPGNVGTIVRSAEAFGATGVIAGRGTADPWSPKALRASAGSVLRLPLLRGVAIPVLLAQLRMARVKILAAGTRPGDGSSAKGANADASITELRGACAIFIGNEGSGLPSEVEHAADEWVYISMNEDVESLNAGVAASVILFEAARQRRGV